MNKVFKCKCINYNGHIPEDLIEGEYYLITDVEKPTLGSNNPSTYNISGIYDKENNCWRPVILKYQSYGSCYFYTEEESMSLFRDEKINKIVKYDNETTKR